MTYRVYIVTTPKNKPENTNTEYFPKLKLHEVNKKIDKLNELTSPKSNKNNCLEWHVNHNKIEMTVIHNKTNETVETASSLFLQSNKG